MGASRGSWNLIYPAMYKSSSGLTALQLTLTLTIDLEVRRQFKGVWAADEVPRSNQPGLYIFNTATSKELGRHWISIYIPEQGPGEFIDSLGHSPEYYQDKFVNFLVEQHPSYMLNDNRLQDYGSSTCGYYAIFYGIHRCRGWKMMDIVHLFGRDLNKNDIKVVDFVHAYLNV